MGTRRKVFPCHTECAMVVDLNGIFYMIMIVFKLQEIWLMVLVLSSNNTHTSKYIAFGIFYLFEVIKYYVQFVFVF